jgi:hypothetical protein
MTSERRSNRPRAEYTNSCDEEEMRKKSTLRHESYRVLGIMEARDIVAIVITAGLFTLLIIASQLLGMGQ